MRTPTQHQLDKIYDQDSWATIAMLAKWRKLLSLTDTVLCSNESQGTGISDTLIPFVKDVVTQHEYVCRNEILVFMDKYDWIICRPSPQTAHLTVPNMLINANKGVIAFMQLSFNEPTHYRNRRADFLMHNPPCAIATVNPRPMYNLTKYQLRYSNMTYAWFLWVKDNVDVTSIAPISYIVNWNHQNAYKEFSKIDEQRVNGK